MRGTAGPLKDVVLELHTPKYWIPPGMVFSKISTHRPAAIQRLISGRGEGQCGRTRVGHAVDMIEGIPGTRPFDAAPPPFVSEQTQSRCPIRDIPRPGSDLALDRDTPHLGQADAVWSAVTAWVKRPANPSDSTRSTASASKPTRREASESESLSLAMNDREAELRKWAVELSRREALF